jgi:HD-GYP domain-containing protein (c-di-GMP phosphodiesterase class II)
MATSASTLNWFFDAATAARGAGAWEQALAQYETSLTRVPKEGDARVASEILRGIGNVHYARGDLDHAREAFGVSLSIAEANGLAEQAAAALNCLAVVEQYSGDIETAEALYTRARALADETGDERRAAMIEQNLGTLANVRGEVKLALRRYKAAFERFERMGDALAATRVLNNMAMGYVDLEAWDAAEDCFREAQRRVNALGDQDTLGAIEINRTELELRRGNFDQARDSCDRAFEIFTRLESKTGIAETCKFYGAIYRETGKLHHARTHLQLGTGLARLCDDRLLEAEVERELALVHLEGGEDQEAVRCLNRAHRLFTELRAKRELVDVEHRLDKLEKTYLEAARRWAEGIESRDRFAAGHAERVADFSCRLAEAMGMRGREVTHLRMGALLHDVGMVDVPEELLNRPGALSAHEHYLMRTHADCGDRMVVEMDFPWEIRQTVRGHHERWDGSGYPDGLAAEAIPLSARIVAIAEVYDALTTRRSYREALAPPDALDILSQEAGVLFDPTLVTLFRELVDPKPVPGITLYPASRKPSPAEI